MKQCTVRNGTYKAMLERAERQIVLTVEDGLKPAQDIWLAPAKARKLFNAGLQMCDEIDAEKEAKDGQERDT